MEEETNIHGRQNSNIPFRKTFSYFMSGVVVGIGVNMLIQTKHDSELEYMLFVASGPAVGSLLFGNYNSRQERLACSLAAYTGSIAGQMIQQSFKGS